MINSTFTFYPYNSILVSTLTVKSDNDKIFCKTKIMRRHAAPSLHGIVLTTRWTESVTKEMAEVKSANTTPAMIDIQSLAPYLVVVVW